MQSRQQVFIGKENQEKLRKSTAAVVGLGGTGHATAEYLARAGVNLILVDNDVVEKCNLGRQTYQENDIGRSKALVMKEKLPFANIEAHAEMLSPSNIDKLLSKSDIVIDGTDNFETRFLINDYCVKHKIPFTYAGAIRAECSFMLWMPSRACLRCIFGEKKGDDSCERDGILSPVAAFAGTLSAIEAIKCLIGEKPVEGLMNIDFFKNKFDVIETKKKENCSCNA